MRMRSLFSPAAAVGLLVAFGAAAPTFAQSPGEQMAECQQLYAQWKKYNGTSAYSPDVRPNVALEDCRKGNYASGIGELKQLLAGLQMNVSPSETAKAPR